MLLLSVAEVQKVELVGGEGWLSQNLGSLVLAAAAFLAAYVVLRNHRQQLLYDRALRNRDYVRDTIDASAAAASDMRTTVDRLLATITTIEGQREEGAGEDALLDLQKKGNAAHQEAINLMFTMREMEARLEIRLDRDHPIVTSYGALRRALNSLVSVAIPGFQQNRESQLKEHDQGKTERKPPMHFAHSKQRVAPDLRTHPRKRVSCAGSKDTRESQLPTASGEEDAPLREFKPGFRTENCLCEAVCANRV
jgi:hypothetical protein